MTRTIKFLLASFIVFMIFPEVSNALTCENCSSIIPNQYCDGTGQVTCTGPSSPAWTRAETKCCLGTRETCITIFPTEFCKYFTTDGCKQYCYNAITFTQCTSNCFNQDCCQGGNIIAGHCSGVAGASPSCWFGNRYKTCCALDGSGREAPCSMGGDCPSQYGKNLCPSGYYATAPGVLTCTATAPLPTSTPVPGFPTSVIMPTPEPTIRPNPYCSLGDLESCDSWINIDVPLQAEIGTAVPIRAFQHPGWCGMPGKDESCECIHQGIDYYVNGPSSFTHRAHGFSTVHRVSSITTAAPVGHTWYNTKVREATNYLMTEGMAPGTYSFYDGYYGSHSDNCDPGGAWSLPCCDQASGIRYAYTGYDYMRQILGRAPNRTLTLYGQVDPPEGGCPVGTTPSGYLNIDFLNPDFRPQDPWLWNWSTVRGDPVIDNPWGTVYPRGNSSEVSKSKYEITARIPNLVTGDTYLLTTWGVGSRWYHSESGCEAKQYPYMKLESGARVTDWYRVSDSVSDYKSKSLAVKLYQPYLDVSLKSDGGQDCWGVRASGSRFSNIRLQRCIPNPRPPVFNSFRLLNLANTELIAETFTGGPGNHICDKRLNQTDATERWGKFVLNISDPDGGGDVNLVSMRLVSGANNVVINVPLMSNTTVGAVTTSGNTSGVTVSGVTTSVNGQIRSVIVPVKFETNYLTAVYDIQVSARDISNLNFGFTSVGRRYKIWNCEVNVSGSVFDVSGVAGPSCLTNNGYTTLFNNGSSYGLVFTGIGAADKAMSVNNMNNNPQYSDGGQRLLWHKSYVADFSGLDGSAPNNMRVYDSVTGVSSVRCLSQVVFDNQVANPYRSSPATRIEFLSEKNQEPWFQAVGGGVIGWSLVTNKAPITCMDECKPVLSLGTNGGSDLNDGVVSAPSISSYIPFHTTHTSPRNYYATLNIVDNTYGYDWFYSEYFKKLKIGTTLNGNQDLSNLGNFGVYFISGDLRINTNKQVGTNDYLIVVVSGNINFDAFPGVNRVDGIYVADGSIRITNDTDNQVVFNGSLYGNSITINRGFVAPNLSWNNTRPAVVINYRPDFLFNMPQELIKILSRYYDD